MLFAHLTVFLASIAFLLFAMRYKQQIMAEKMLTLFSLIYLLIPHCFYLINTMVLMRSCF
jgi:pilus assembly protein TadC